MNNENYKSDDEDKKWRCKNCSMKNTQSTKRCESCGEPQHAVFAAAIDDTYHQNSQSDEEQENYHHNRPGAGG